MIAKTFPRGLKPNCFVPGLMARLKPRPFKTAGAIVLAMACVAAAQSGSSAQTGTGVYRIAGTVVNAVTGQPVRIGLSGSTAPMELALRDDCAALQLSLPETLASITAGEEPFFTVYVVPDFDSTADVEPVTLRPSTGGNITLNGLTPGNYRVYTFAGAVQLAYRNREALAYLKNPGQAVTLSPGATGNLVVEAARQ